ncbi:MAG: hypothetical protein JWP88_1874 [Flaviaesturariibacter sp.]|nr:hypothetical protein [Flaviaesturariibacter sp.]
MREVSLLFRSLSELAECMFAMGVDKPEINYEKYILKANLSEEQLEHAISMKAQIVDKPVIK